MGTTPRTEHGWAGTCAAIALALGFAAPVRAFDLGRLELVSSVERDAAMWELVEDTLTPDAALEARAAAPDASPQLRWALARVLRWRRLGYTRASWALAGDALARYETLDWRARVRLLDEYARRAGPAGLAAMAAAGSRDPSPRVRAHALALAGRLGLVAVGPEVNRLVRAGAWDAALAVLDALQARYPGEAEVHYQAVCVLALAGRVEPALDRLARAIGCGFDDTQRLDLDPDLASLRDQRRYQDLVKTIR